MNFQLNLDHTYSQIFRLVKPYTMTGQERVYALVNAVGYIVRNYIPGDFVECGVWKGGSIMAAALTLSALSCTDRYLYLYDTFEGFVKPTEVDINLQGESASEKFERTRISDNSSDWCNVSLDEVKKAVYSTGYDTEKFRFVKGKIEDTIPGTVPERVALLRLDADWYESTHHELIHLFPKLSYGGVIIIDDYGHWQGARKAVDEYVEQYEINILFHRIDYTGRIGIRI